MPNRWATSRTLLVLVASIVLVNTAITAIKWGVADWYWSNAVADMDDWNAQRDSINYRSGNEWSKTRDTLLAAQQLESGSPTILETLGMLHVQPVAYPEGTTQWLLGEALNYFRHALIVRPVSPYTWSNIALTKYRLGEIDNDLYHALEQSIALGPWEPEVQFVAADLGFALWDEMPSSLRESVAQTVERAARYHANKIIRMAENRGRLFIVCKYEKFANEKVCSRKL